MSRITEVERDERAQEIDLRAVGSALRRRRAVILIPTLVAFLLVGAYVLMATPRYTAESQILLENQETFFTRPDRVNLPAENTVPLDETAVASQVQLVSSPDLARRVIRQLDLANDPEFESATGALVNRILGLLGLAEKGSGEGADARHVNAFLKNLMVFSPSKTRVITIQFTSRDPARAAKIANTIAADYIETQSVAKRTMAKDSAKALSAQITDLRGKLAKADSDREAYRSQSGLLAGANSMTITGQQLADINSELSKARTTQADAQAKASMIRELLKSGKAADVADVTNNDIVRRLWDQRAVAQAQLALESRTLLPGHPRIKELTAEVEQYDTTLRSAAKQAAATLENEARIAGTRVSNLETVLTQQKKLASVANGDEVHLHALERIAQGLKDQLESSTTKYEEALARQSSDATPADARIITRATVPQDASFPKKIPYVAFGTLAALVLSTGYVIASEIMSGGAAVGVAPRPDPYEEAAPYGLSSARTQRPDRVRRPATREPATTAFHLPEGLKRGEPGKAPDDVVFAPVAENRPLREPAPRKAGLLEAASAYLKAFGRSAADTRDTEMRDAEMRGTDTPATVRPSVRDTSAFGWETETAPARPTFADPVASRPEAPAPVAEAPASHAPLSAQAALDMPAMVERIVAAHVPGRGLHIVGTSLDALTPGSAERLLVLGRRLADRGRSIIVDLNRTAMKLAALCGEGEAGAQKVMTMPGLAELLAGDVSFAEVIHRDHASKLHFVPTGMSEADFRDFDLILDALSETYDFVLLMIPGYPESEIARVMAPYADFMVLSSNGSTDAATLARRQGELVEAGARHVLIASPSAEASRAVAESAGA